jgi:hypothetical protein
VFRVTCRSQRAGHSLTCPPSSSARAFPTNTGQPAVSTVTTGGHSFFFKAPTLSSLKVWEPDLNHQDLETNPYSSLFRERLCGTYSNFQILSFHMEIVLRLFWHCFCFLVARKLRTLVCTFTLSLFKTYFSCTIQNVLHVVSLFFISLASVRRLVCAQFTH